MKGVANCQQFRGPHVPFVLLNLQYPHHQKNLSIHDSNGLNLIGLDIKHCIVNVKVHFFELVLPSGAGMHLATELHTRGQAILSCMEQLKPLHDQPINAAAISEE
jgi:hypothetical protein